MKDCEYTAWFAGVREMIWTDLAGLVDGIEATDRVPNDTVIPLLARHGLWGCMVPEEYGGIGLTVRQYVPVLIELSKLYGGLRGFLHTHVSASCMLLGATETQKRELYPGVASGKIMLAFGLTEPDAGTGVDIKTTAVRDGDDYVINGRKHLISNCDIADYIMLVCYTDRSKGAGGISAMILPTDAPGFRWEPLKGTMGTKGAEHGRLFMDDCRIPAANLIGGVEGMGLKQAMSMLEESRIFIASTSVGAAERSFELALAYSQERITFGKRICERESVRAYLAEMAMDIYAMRSMLADTVTKIDRGESAAAEASMCKAFCAEAVCRVTDRALLIFGGRGYTTEYEIERQYRDCRINLIEEGTPSIQRMVIARDFLKGYRFADLFAGPAVPDSAQ